MNMPFLTMQALLGTDKRPPELPADDSEPGRLTQAIAATRDGSENAEALRLLRAAGVQAITGSCGFMARFQSQIAAELHVPVFLSSLLQLPLVRLMHGEKAEIGVLTASSQALTPAHFANCATPMESVHIRGMEGNPEFWETIIEGKRHDFDMERLEAEIVGSAAAFAREKALDALVLECTDLSAFSAPIQRAINLPVYDINSLVEYAYYAVCRKDY